MAEDKNRILVNDFRKPILNTRIQYIDENDTKIKGRKGFLFNSFESEKARIVCTYITYIIQVEKSIRRQQLDVK